MPRSNPPASIEHLSDTVNAPPAADLDPFSALLRHHKSQSQTQKLVLRGKSWSSPPPYGVSSSRRILTPGLLFSRFDQVRDCLDQVLGLSTGQREVVLRLLRLWAHYGAVYPKESQVTELPGCSKATFWRTVRILRSRGLVQVINRYLIREHAQISNYYRLDRLVLLIARYLSERGARFQEEWLRPALVMAGSMFWRLIYHPGYKRKATGYRHSDEILDSFSRSRRVAPGATL